MLADTFRYSQIDLWHVLWQFSVLLRHLLLLCDDHGRMRMRVYEKGKRKLLQTVQLLTTNCYG